MESISIAADLFFPSDEEIVWLVERYDLVIEEICEANATPPACYIYSKPGGPITEYLRFFDWVLKGGGATRPGHTGFHFFRDRSGGSREDRGCCREERNESLED